MIYEIFNVKSKRRSGSLRTKFGVMVNGSITVPARHCEIKDAIADWSVSERGNLPNDKRKEIGNNLLKNNYYETS